MARITATIALVLALAASTGLSGHATASTPEGAAGECHDPPPNQDRTVVCVCVSSHQYARCFFVSDEVQF